MQAASSSAPGSGPDRQVRPAVLPCLAMASVSARACGAHVPPANAPAHLTDPQAPDWLDAHTGTPVDTPTADRASLDRHTLGLRETLRKQSRCSRPPPFARDTNARVGLTGTTLLTRCFARVTCNSRSGFSQLSARAGTTVRPRADSAHRWQFHVPRNRARRGVLEASDRNTGSANLLQA